MRRFGSSSDQSQQILLTTGTTHPFFSGEYVLNNKSLCPSNADNLDVLVVVHSAPTHFQRRQNIRTTYGSSFLFSPKTIRVVFLLGLTKSAETQHNLIHEHSLRGDIIQGHFLDSYHNLTIKAVMGLHWISHYCENVTHVVKTDDDVVFDMWRFLSAFKPAALPKTLFCDVSWRGIIRRKGKWKVSDNVYRGYERYPFPHCYGFVVILRGDLVPDLYRASFAVSFFWIDDVYIFGMLPNYIGNIRFDPAKHNMTLQPKLNGLKCLKAKGEKCPVLAVTATVNSFEEMWSLIKKRNKGVKVQKYL